MLTRLNSKYFLLISSLVLISFAYFYPLFLPQSGLLYYVIPSVTGLLVFGLLYSEVVSTKTLFEESLRPAVLLFLAVGVVNDIIIGLVSGFGRNPLTLTQTLMIFNLVREVPRVLGTEFFRGFILSNWKRVKVSLVVVSLLFTFLGFTYTKYLSLLTSSYSSSLNFLLRSFAPFFLNNLLVSYLFVLGGIKNSLIYSMFTRLYTYLMPVLPNVSISVSAVVGSVQVFVFFVILGILFFGDHVVSKPPLYSRLLSLGLLLTTFAVLVFILAGYRALVVVSGSMAPFLSVGDIAVVNTRVSQNGVMVGDVVAFYLGRDVVIHRVVRIINTSSGVKYVTRGDANESPDPFRVTPNALLGKYVFKIPLVGYLWIYLMQALLNYQNLIIVVMLLMTSSLIKSSFGWFNYAWD